MPKSAVGRIIPPGELGNDGEVIFGQYESPLLDLITSPSNAQQNSIYSQPNVPIDVPTPKDQIENNPHPDNRSENERVLQSDSDTTDSTGASYITSSSHESITSSITDFTIDLDPTSCKTKRPRDCDKTVWIGSDKHHTGDLSESRKRMKNSDSLGNGLSGHHISCTISDADTRTPGAVNQCGSVSSLWLSHRTQEYPR